MTGMFSFDDSPAPEIALLHNNIAENKAFALKIIESCKDKMIQGMQMYISGNSFGVSIIHPLNAPGHKTSDCVLLNQSKQGFINQANYSCNKLYKMAKYLKNRYGDLPIKPRK